jgi:hypothetical protein
MGTMSRAREVTARIVLALGVTVATLGGLELGLRASYSRPGDRRADCSVPSFPPVRLVPPEAPRACPARLRRAASGKTI